MLPLLQDVIHLYVGQKFYRPGSTNEYLIGITYNESGPDRIHLRYMDGLGWGFPIVNIEHKPILRPLSDINSHEEKNAIEKWTHEQIPLDNKGKWISASLVLYLLKHGFDLFSLIESGLAIDKTKIEIG